MTLAIDFGTSNTVVARWNPVTQCPETLRLPGLSQIQAQTPPLIPSWLYVQSAQPVEVLAGQAVGDRGLDLDGDPRFFRCFKRGIGHPIQGYLPTIEHQPLTFEQIGEWFLRQVIQGIQGTGIPLESLVVTVPVDSFEAYRHWLGSVFTQLAIPQVRLVDEPTAAALGYGASDRDLVLVVDFGGGTLDLSLVRLPSASGATRPLGFLLKWGDQSFQSQSNQQIKTAQVLAKVGKNLGGSDIDHWIADYFSQLHGIPATPLLTRLGERLKIELSRSYEALETYFDEENFESYSLRLDRSTLSEILQQHHFFEQLEQSMQQLLQQALQRGIAAEDMGAVLLVGGTSQIPGVQAWIRSYFNSDRIHSNQPFEAIAHGALHIAQGLTIKDFLYHSYGVRYWNHRQQRHDWHPLIPTGQPYPMEQPVELVLGASVVNQPSLELVVGELGDSSNHREVYFEGGRLVTRPLGGAQTLVQVLNGSETSRTLAQLDPPGTPGHDRVKVQFWVDEARFLRVTVEDLLTLETLVQNQALVQLV